MRLQWKMKGIWLALAATLLTAGAYGAETESIQSDALDVSIGTSFPQVLKYTWKANGAVLHGQEKRLTEVKLNSEAYAPKISFRKTGGNRAEYTLDFPQLKLSMNVEMAVVGNVMDFKISRIDEDGPFRLESIEFPEHDLISVRSDQPQSALATALVSGGWSKIDEQFSSLAEKEVDAEPVKQTYVVVNTARLAASIDNNVIQYERTRSQASEEGGLKHFSAWNGVWTYREAEDPPLALPWSRVIIVDDRNGDATVDWQDGAIGYRENMPEPLGSELIRNSISYVSFNGGSVAIAPFLRALADAKQLYLMTDGFGQLVELKGYQSEGHDAAHPDCAGNYNNRAGGLKDLRSFLEFAPKYNIHPGVHINISESYPEAHNFSDTILQVPHRTGWVWYDRSLRMDYRKDILSGSLYARLDQMKAELPGLKWVYVDVYGGGYGNDFWAAHKLGTKLNGNGWMVASEYFGPMERRLLWVHHYNAVPRTRLIRFIKNQCADIFSGDPLLRGGQALGIGGWENNYDFNKVVRKFFLHNLPTKYMQHFPIMRWSDGRIDFTGGVHVENSNGWKLYKDGKMLSDGYSVFIPWDPVAEEKIYYQSTSTETRWWDLPGSWQDEKELKLYKLTPLGREFVKDLYAEDGRVGIFCEPNTPHVIYPEEAPEQEMVWGEGSLLKDQCFSSRELDAWTVSSPGGSRDHVTIEDDGNANAILTVNNAGNNGSAALLAQRISGLEPGKSYSASAWVNVSGGRRAWVGVKLPGRETISNWVDRTDLVRSEGRLKYRGTTFQRVAVKFAVPAGVTQAMFLLAADRGDPASKAQFDDIRIAGLPGITEQGGRLLFEDFENVDEQWGPFVAANGTDHTHLSELHEGYTDDTINGRFSLKNFNEGKSGEIYRTVQSTLKLQPNTRYAISFEYINKAPDIRFAAVKSKDGGDAATVLNETIPEGEGSFSARFTTGDFTDYYVAIGTKERNGSMLVIDDFAIDTE